MKFKDLIKYCHYANWERDLYIFKAKTGKEVIIGYSKDGQIYTYGTIYDRSHFKKVRKCTKKDLFKVFGWTY